MAFWELVTGKLMAPRVVHSLPGRLRVHVPALCHLPEDMKPLVGHFEKILKVSSTIEKATLNLRSGNILVCYCQESAKEKDVLSFLSRMLKLLSMNKERFTGQVRDLDSIVTNICSHLEGTMSPNLYFSEEVPEDVWS